MSKEIKKSEESLITNEITNDKTYLEDLTSFAKIIKNNLLILENKANEKIIEIENIFEHGNKNDREIMNKLLAKRKLLNRKEGELFFQKELQSKKNLQDFEILEKARKIVVKNRRNIIDYSIINNKKTKIKKIIIKDKINDDIKIEYTEDE